MEAGDHSIADPLLVPERGPRDPSGELVRAPVGNAAWTLVLFVVVLLAGAGYWWWQRPSDLTQLLGGREWVITHIDEEPLGADRELVSTFVLDGTGEARGMADCNVQTGRWAIEGRSNRLEIEWTSVTLMGCSDWPSTIDVGGGAVSLDGATLRIDSGQRTLTAVALVDLPMATPEEMVGEWTSHGRVVEFGRRGLFRVDDCRGEWLTNSDDPESISFDVPASEIASQQCEMDRLWANGTPMVPVLHDGSLFLRREGTMFPLDRSIVRLDPVDQPLGG